jgi:hypothetical protein
VPNCSKPGCAKTKPEDFNEYYSKPKEGKKGRSRGRLNYSGMCKEHQKEYQRERYARKVATKAGRAHVDAPVAIQQRYADPRSGWSKKCSYKLPEAHELDALLPARSFYLEKNGQLHGYCFDCQKRYSRTYGSEQEVAIARQPRDSKQDPVLAALNFYGAVEYALSVGGTTAEHVMYGIAQLEIDGPIEHDLYQKLWEALEERNTTPRALQALPA